MPQLQVKQRIPYVRIGNSGLKVSKIILGCMSYGDKSWAGWVLPEEEAIEQIKFAYENGIQTFDTANVYSNGVSEIILGKAIKKLNLPREEIVVMTKVSFVCGRTPDQQVIYSIAEAEEKGYVNQRGLSRKHIFDSVKASLKRLDLKYIDLLQCHRFDPETPIEETMQALHDVVKAGYVRYIGMSSCYAYQFHIMQNYAISHGLTPFISMQNHYNLLYREEEREMMPTLKHFGVGSLPWSPLAGGAACRPVSKTETTVRAATDHFDIGAYVSASSAGPIIVNRIEELSKKYEVTMAQVALAWVLAKPGVSAPVIGTTSLKNLKDNLGALDVKLSEDDVRYLDEPYTPIPVRGHF